MRGLRSTIVLAVILAGLVGYIYYLNKHGETNTTDTKEKPFAQVSADDVEEIQIKAQGDTSRVQKSSGTWKLVEPAAADADASELSSITSSLAAVDIQSVVDEKPSDLKQYGLDPARVEVSFRVKGQKDSRRIFFGDKTPTGGDLYAKLPDQPRVFLVSSFLDSTFNKSTFALRDKAILKFERDKADGLELTSGKTSVEFAKSGSEWKIVKPVAARADYGAIEGAIERLSSAQMQAVIAPETDNLKQYGLDQPSATMVVKLGSSRAILMLGRTSNAVVFAKDLSRPMIFTVAPTVQTDVIKDVGEYRRKDLFDFRSFTANHVELKRGAESFAFEKAKGKDGKEVWRNAAGKDVDMTKIEDLLTKVSSLRAQLFQPAVHPSLRMPALTVVARFDNRSETVTFGRAGGDVFASRPDEPGAAKLEASSFDEAMKALDAMK
jgi:uncharacterized protein DUF4340